MVQVRFVTIRLTTRHYVTTPKSIYKIAILDLAFSCPMLPTNLNFLLKNVRVSDNFYDKGIEEMFHSVFNKFKDM